MAALEAVDASNVADWYAVQEPKTLRVVESSPLEQLSHAAVKFTFPSSLLPQAALVNVRGNHYLTVISAGGVLYSIHLRHSSGDRPEASVLHGTPKVFILSLHVSGQHLSAYFRKLLLMTIHCHGALQDTQTWCDCKKVRSISSFRQSWPHVHASSRAEILSCWYTIEAREGLLSPIIVKAAQLWLGLRTAELCRLLLAHLKILIYRVLSCLCGPWERWHLIVFNF